MFEQIDHIAAPVSVLGWLMPAAPSIGFVRKWLADEQARQRLAECQNTDSRFAKDVGLSPEQIAMECAAPFWAAFRLSRY